jgi:pimeloyl-ACP methyl ester carboxylesterase
MRHESAQLLGCRVDYWLSPDEHAKVLVLLHGLSADHTGLLDLAARLHGVRIVAIDLPGFGRSDPLPGRHTLDGYVDIVEELRRHLGVDRFTLLGHSLGGSIALAYAGRYGAALDALCLLHPVFIPDTTTARLARLYYTMSRWLPGAWERLLLTSRPAVYLTDRGVFTTRDRAIRQRILRMDYATARSALPRAIRESCLSLYDMPFDRYAAEVGTRTLVVTGELDWLCTPESVTRLRWPEPATRLTIVPGTGHLLPVEEPDLTARIVNDFLADHRLTAVPDDPAPLRGDQLPPGRTDELAA